MAAILEVSGLKKSYKNFELKNVSFSIYEDCITGFIGVNGAGKTTTINALLNLVHRDDGIIKFRGKDISTDEKTFKDKIGVVFDSGCFYDELTIKDMTALLAPAYSEWDNHIYKQYLERFSLQQEQTIGTLSKGMKMKYALALALSHNAELLIMDEPTSGLDPLMREQFINILKSYIEPGGRAVFYSTHNTTDLDKSADMLIMINAGKILFEEEKDFLLEKFRVVKGDVKYSKWVQCPTCGSNTRTKIRFDTILENFPLFCPKCKQEALIHVRKLNVVIIDNKTRSRKI